MSRSWCGKNALVEAAWFNGYVSIAPRISVHMNHPVVIGAVAGVLCGLLVALISRWRAGHWRYGTAAAVAGIVAVVTGVPAIWYGWIAVVYGITAGLIFGFITVREAIDGR